MFSSCLNLKNRAFTQLTTLPFTSLGKMGDRLLATGPQGLYLLCGDNDDGNNIYAFFETVLSDWGIPQNKRPRFCFLSLIGLKVRFSILDGDGAVQASLEVAGTSETLPQMIQFPIPRTTARRYWKFRVESIDGHPFSIDKLLVHFIVRPHGVSKRV